MDVSSPDADGFSKEDHDAGASAPTAAPSRTSFADRLRASPPPAPPARGATRCGAAGAGADDGWRGAAAGRSISARSHAKSLRAPRRC
jgi:hypothetical protein